MDSRNFAVATFAAGCFWGIEELFRHQKGVKNTIVGYAGGRGENPSYEMVCSDKTGHAESVQVTYSPIEISYDELLAIFWMSHDATHSSRWDNYRSAIFYHSEEQKNLAEESKKEIEKEKKKPIVTEIVPASIFYPAEEYHQQFLEKTGGVCRMHL